MFSDTVQLADINDFINPEQECIIQTGSNVKLDNDFLMDDGIGSVKVKQRKKSNNKDFGHFDQIVTDKSTNTAKITLDDCLACSGCITSAETVLIKQQSTQQMESYLTTHKNSSLIVTISNQAFIAIANKYNMDIQLARQKISAFFKQEYNAKYVFDTSVALEIVMKEAIHEFITNYKKNFIESNKNEGLTESKNNDDNDNGMEIDSFQNEEKKEEISKNIKLPILTSECPGFVCYAEKSCKATVLEYISSLKSPQQIMGLLIKKYLFDKINKEKCNNTMKKADDIYHVTVMPCYDKKLEASRKEFIIDNNSNIKEVDCVITSIEIEQLLISKNINDLSNFKVINDNNCDDMIGFIDSNITYTSDLIIDSKGSHGYLENMFIYTAKELFGIDLKVSELKYKKLRNEDIEELTLILNEEQINKLPFKLKNKTMERTGKVLHFLRCYGFRNIQNVIRKIEKNKSKYHYVEIMACPFGCLNGGGQIRMDMDDIEMKKLSKQKEHIQNMRDLLYKSQVINQINKNYDINTSIKKISDVVYQQILQSNVGQTPSFNMTLKHVGDTDNTKLNINW